MKIESSPDTAFVSPAFRQGWKNGKHFFFGGKYGNIHFEG